MVNFYVGIDICQYFRKHVFILFAMKIESFVAFES